MGSVKFKRPVLLEGGLQDKIQALTGGSTGTNLTNEGISKLVVSGTESATAATYVYTLESPVLAGVHKTIIVDNNSTRLIQVRTPTSTEVIFGTTKNAVQWSTGSTAPPAHVELVSLTTTQWAVVNISSTSITLVGATA